jgi:hypothetical protein
LQIKIDENSKIVEFWLSGPDQRDAALLACLKPMFAKWKAKKYLPVVYRSGTEDLQELTSALLKDCRNRAARREAERRRMLAETAAGQSRRPETTLRQWGGMNL